MREPDPTTPGAQYELDPERKERERQFHNEVFGDNRRLTKGMSRVYQIALPAMEKFRAEVVRRATGKTVLEYGCGKGTNSFELSKVARHVVGIDISEVAIEQAKERRERLGAANTEFHVMDAENLTFPDASFDLVVGRAIVHHLNVERCCATVARVLRTDGMAMFQEPLGHNPLINLFRNRTPDIRTVDEHPLRTEDLATALRHFGDVEIKPYALTTLACVPLAGTPLFRPVHAVFAGVDAGLLALPVLKWWAWTSIWRLSKPRPAGQPQA
jgi:ubiquinone/menaquinone biosynthesis C-methylase UbiE